jgi:hypothetical protein
MKYLYVLMLAAFPLVSAAQNSGQAVFFNLIGFFQGLISAAIPVVIGLAVLVFIWGILQYIVSKDSEKQKEARGIIIWGIIILFVMISIWGLVELLGATLGVGQGTMTISQFLDILAETILNPLINLAFAVALVYFLFGVYKYVKYAGSPDKRKEGSKHIIWGLVGLFIMVSVWTILEIALNTFGI